MRNLKRVLSLALALVMVLGMMVITTSAADYTDADDITYKEAVDVMSAIGILKGELQADGTYAFNPTDTLTREGAAKILAFICLGTEADNYLSGSTTDPFTDVKADRWSAKYVSYCKNLGIIDGNGDGSFNPKGNISTVGFGKLVLGAVGIDGTYTGAGWENNVKTALEDADLDVITIDNTDITREEACELALAAMQYSVAPDVYEVRYTNDTKVTYEKIGEFGDLFEATMYCKLLANDYADEDENGNPITGEGYYVQKAAAKDTLLSDNYGVSSEDDHDDFGRPGVRYTSVIDEEFDLFFADKALVTYTAPVKAEDIAKAYAKYTFAAGKEAADISNAADYGVVVEVYGSAATKTVTDIVVIEELLGKVTKVTEAKGEAKRTVTVAGKTFETESFAKGDVVLYTVGDVSGEIESMVIPATVTGKIESYNDTLGTVTIDGEPYNYGRGFSLSADFVKDQVFTLYSDGSIVAQAAASEAAAAASTNYVYVTKVQYQAYDAGTTTLLGTTDAKAAAVAAEVIFTDGTKDTVNLTVTDVTTNPASPAYEVDVIAPDGSVTTEQTLDDTLVAAHDDDDGCENIGNWFAYTVAEDGTYTLTELDGKYAAVEADADDLILVKDQMEVVAGKYTTTETKINSISAKGVVTTKVGFEAATLTGKVLVTYAKDATTATALYAVLQGDADPVVDTTIYYAVKAGNSVKGGTEWTFAANGEQVTYVIKSSEVGELSKGGFYTLTAGTDDDTGLYLVDDEAVSPATALVTLISGDKVAFSDGTIKTLSDKINVYNIGDTAEVVGEVKTLEVGDIIKYTVNGDSEVANVWVYAVEGTVEVETAAELVAAVANEPVGVIVKMTKNITLTVANALVINKSLTLDGDGFVLTASATQTGNNNDKGCLNVVAANVTLKNLTVVGPNTTATGWDNGEYGIKLYGADAVLENVTVKKANAGIQVAANTTVKGYVDVSENEFGGIEVKNQAKLTISTNADLINSTETATLPTVWCDTATDGTVVGGGLTKKDSANASGQTFWYLDASNAS